MWVYDKGVTSYCEVTPLLYDKLYTKKRDAKCCISTFRAEDGAQTRDPQLGRLMLYQLSYFRKILSEFCEIFATLGN